MYSIFGHDVNDLRVWLTEQRFPDQWEPRNREALGHTIMVRFSSLQSLLHIVFGRVDRGGVYSKR
jgi:hypothetical protein